MLSSSPARMWLGSATLAGLLLASSLTSSTPSSTTILRSSLKPTLVSSNTVSTGTYTQAVRKKLQWTASPMIPNKATTNVTNQSKPTQAKQVVAAAGQPAKAAQSTNTKPVKVATASKKQVSRSDDSNLVDHALGLVGVPYSFGGTTLKGFDCSGYTQYVFKGSGVSLPRTAAEQFNVGSSVSSGQLQSGDLVFFHTYTSGPSHVGIYIGGGRFVHASNGGVQVSNLNDSYYSGRSLGARRVR